MVLPGGGAVSHERGIPVQVATIENNPIICATDSTDLAGVKAAQKTATGPVRIDVCLSENTSVFYKSHLFIRNHVCFFETSSVYLKSRLFMKGPISKDGCSSDLASGNVCFLPCDQSAAFIRRVENGRNPHRDLLPRDSVELVSFRAMALGLIHREFLTRDSGM